ncbi:MAG: UvrD-helicase domain-containing protein, partial [Pseudomonadota bacterium]|nr:UvrD-helicase domain-containing protein [Pseudomonadota bacterium]
MACDPRQSVVVEACAGSGKTWMLVARILRALLDGAEAHEILAITFTRAAAGEMRDRLGDWLARWAEPRSSHGERVAALVERGLQDQEAERAAPLLGALQGRLLAAGRKVEIRTFHAWFAQLLRSAPLESLEELGLQPDMTLVEDPEEHRGAVMRAFQAAVLRDPQLSEDYRALSASRGRSQLGKWLASAWNRRIEIELADAAGTLETSVATAESLWPELAGLAHPSMLLAQAP